MNRPTKSLFALALTTALLASGLVSQAAETQEIIKVDINPSGSSTPSFLTAIDDYVYFTADDGSNGREIWFTDGTAAGTVSVGNINPSGNAINDERVDPFFHLLDGYVYYRATNGTDGLELYRSPLGQSGFEQISNLNGATGGFYTISLQYWHNPLAPMYTEDIVSHGGKLYFRAWNSASSVWQLYSYDPSVTPNPATSAGLTNMTHGLTGDVHDLVVWNNALHFVFKPTGAESVLYKLAGSPLAPVSVVSASVVTQGTIFRLMPVGDYLLFLDGIGTTNADLRYITAAAPSVSVAITNAGPIKTDLGTFMRPTVIGNEIYFETTNANVTNDLALRYVNLDASPITLETVVGSMPTSTSGVRNISRVEVVGDTRYVIHAASAFSYSLYEVTGSTLSAPLGSAGDLLTQLKNVDGSLFHQASFSGDLDVAVRAPGGSSTRTADSVEGGSFVPKQIEAIGRTAVISAQAGDWELWLLALVAPQGGATPFTGPKLNPIIGPVNPGDTVTVTGTELDQVTSAEIDDLPGTISNQT
jgi:ELWxxDGT repeat protein